MTTKKRKSCSPWDAIILGSSFINYMLNGGMLCLNGLLMSSFLITFGAGEVATSWLASVQMGLCMCSGFISGVMVELYGCRFVAVLGVAITALGYICSAFVRNIWLMYFTYSVMSGLGLGLQFVPCLVVIQYYFVERRTLAAGITTSGSSTGVFLYSLVCQLFLMTFGFQGTLLLTGAIMLHGIPFGIIMTSHPKTQWRPGIRPVHTEPPEIKLVGENAICDDSYNEAYKTNMPRHVDDALANVDIDSSHDAVGKPHPANYPNGYVGDEILRKTPISTSVLLVCKDVTKSSGAMCHKKIGSSVINGNVSILKLCNQHASHSLPQLTHTGLYQHGPEQDSSSTDDGVRLASHSSVFSGQKESLERNSWRLLENKDIDIPSVEPVVKKHSLLSGLGRTFRGMAFGFMELRHPACLLTFLSTFGANFGFQVPYLFLPKKVVLLGYESWSGAFLISIIGMSDTAGRLFFGWVGNCIPKHVPVIYSLGILLSGIGTAGSGLVTSYQGMVIFAVANGFGSGGFVSLNPQTVVEILGFNKIARFIGLMGLASGIAYFTAPCTSALVYEATGRINDPFYFGGSFQIAGALILIIYRLTPYYSQRPGATQEELPLDDLADSELTVASKSPSYIGSIVSCLDSHPDLPINSSCNRLNHAGITLVPMYGSAISVNTMRSEPTHG